MKSLRFFGILLMRFPALLGFLGVAFLAGGCTPSEAGREAPIQSGIPPSAWETLAVLETGGYPLWFELTETGPGLINSPGEASLSPYLPWPQARYAVGLLDWDGRIVLVINREGFLIVEAEKDGRAYLRRAAAPGLWDPYTAGKPFIWDRKPGVLLYRNDFFSEAPGPSPDHRVFFLEEGRSEPYSAETAALEIFSTALDLDVDSLVPGPDGFWYYRATPAPDKRYAGKTPSEYYRSSDLSLPGEKVSLGLWRNSFLPEPLNSAPPVLAAFLDKALKAPFVSGATAASVISSGFPGARVFSGSGESSSVLSGYYRPGPPSLALLVARDGRAQAALNGEDPFPFSLPSLPEDFFYTGIGLAGEILVATWEEQQDSAVGSAGFMALNARLILPLEPPEIAR
jgi:hypothetical protein